MKNLKPFFLFFIMLLSQFFYLNSAHSIEKFSTDFDRVLNPDTMKYLLNIFNVSSRQTCVPSFILEGLQADFASPSSSRSPTIKVIQLGDKGGGLQTKGLYKMELEKVRPGTLTGPMYSGLIIKEVSTKKAKDEFENLDAVANMTNLQRYIFTSNDRKSEESLIPKIIVPNCFLIINPKQKEPQKHYFSIMPTSPGKPFISYLKDFIQSSEGASGSSEIQEAAFFTGYTLAQFQNQQMRANETESNVFERHTIAMGDLHLENVFVFFPDSWRAKENLTWGTARSLVSPDNNAIPLITWIDNETMAKTLDRSASVLKDPLWFLLLYRALIVQAVPMSFPPFLAELKRKYGSFSHYDEKWVNGVLNPFFIGYVLNYSQFHGKTIDSVIDDLIISIDRVVAWPKKDYMYYDPILLEKDKNYILAVLRTLKAEHAPSFSRHTP